MHEKHTPGPWLYDGRDGIAASTSDQLNGGYFTAEVMGPDKVANARLIAAAPDLLTVARDFNEVLRELGKFCECGEADCRTTRLRAAIAKATGAA